MTISEKSSFPATGGEPVATDVANDAFASPASERQTAEFVNPIDFEDYWKSRFYGTLYYACDHGWKDYRSAYLLGYDAFFRHRGRRFDEVETEIARTWEANKDDSHLTWAQARHAVRDGWQFVDNALSEPPSIPGLQ